MENLDTLNLSSEQLRGLLSLLMEGKLRHVVGQTAKSIGDSKMNVLPGTTQRNNNTKSAANDSEPDLNVSLGSSSLGGPSAEKYTARELLEKAGKCKKSNPAQQIFRYVLKQVAARCGFWETAPQINAISPKTMERFLNQVTQALPQLCGHSKEIRNRLAESLRNRRNQKKNTKHWARAAKLKKYNCVVTKREATANLAIPQVKCHTTTADIVGKQLIQEGGRMSPGEEEDEEEDGFNFSSGDELLVMNGADKLARATFVRESSRQDDTGLLVMQANYTSTCNRDATIELPPPNKRVKFLHEVEIGTQFYWTLNQLMKKPKSKVEMMIINQKKKTDTPAAITDTPAAITDTPATATKEKTNPTPKKGGQKRKTDDPHEGNAKSQPKKRTTSADGTAKKKGWKGYIQMSREDFERDLALKQKDIQKALPQKRGRKPKIDSIYTV